MIQGLVIDWVFERKMLDVSECFEGVRKHSIGGIGNGQRIDGRNRSGQLLYKLFRNVNSFLVVTRAHIAQVQQVLG